MSALRNRNVAKIENQYVKQQEVAGIAENRKRKRLFRRLTVFFAFASIITVLMISTTISQTSALEQKQEVVEERKQELSSLKKRQEILEEEIVKLNDDEYIAKLARSEYFLSEKGEIIFKLPDEN
ncbi:FtsB family cell division protein [Mesobacillus foraminis]|jgi:cell division protein DivIC|uniref:Cell division protein DivIC n=1 Tax=Mesobacillus foraminis TaxID=279826 RepID=A0A4V2RBN3_9BACI|nr:septum formation initiator family protein [Mesobacillus foraminis]MBT2759353.1 septum formation initiator family protein [Mesobacillus foraminis]TCN17660.1 cell division protein DivIC [Mesobacillus foraminis]